MAGWWMKNMIKDYQERRNQEQTRDTLHDTKSKWTYCDRDGEKQYLLINLGDF